MEKSIELVYATVRFSYLTHAQDGDASDRLEEQRELNRMMREFQQQHGLEETPMDPREGGNDAEEDGDEVSHCCWSCLSACS